VPGIDQTIALLKELHAGELDKSGKPVWEHPVAVMHRLPRDVSDDVRLAALLHDVVEDVGHYTLERLANMGYSKATLDIVALLTKPKDPSCVYIERIRGIISSGNRDAMEVKLADMMENSDPKRLQELSEEVQQRLLQKYARPIRMMREALHRSNPLPPMG
jgi:(p)ppGpp synthase/HD superfamily hydrolase